MQGLALGAEQPLEVMLNQQRTQSKLLKKLLEKQASLTNTFLIKAIIDHLGHVHTSPFSFRSVFTRKNGASFPPRSHCSVFR